MALPSARLPRPRARLGIRSRLSLVFSALIVLLIGLFGVVSLERYRAAARAELRQTEALLRDNLVRKGTATVQTLALALENALAENSFNFLYEIIRTTRRADPDVSYGMIIDPQGKILVSSDPAQNGHIAATLPAHDATIVEVEAPVGLGNDRLGTLRFGLNLHELEIGLAHARVRQTDELARAVPLYLGVTVGSVLLGLGVALALSRRITKPLSRLTRRAQAIGEGNLDVTVIEGGDHAPGEVEILAATLDGMRLAVKREIADLRAIHDVGKTLAGSLVREEVAAAALTALRARVGGDGGVVYTAHNGTLRLAASEPVGVPRPRELPSSLLDELPASAAVARELPIPGPGLLAPLTVGLRRFGLIGMPGVAPDAAGLQFVDTISSLLAQSLENIRLLEATAEQARIDNELRTAQAVQRALIPSSPPVVDGLEIAATYLPATEVGGDWYGFYPSGDTLHVLIGDVTGHGVPAALLTACACTTCAMLTGDPAVGPATLIERLAGVIGSVGKGELMMTSFAARIDGPRREVVFASAGHNAPYHLSARGLGVLATGPTHVLGARGERAVVREHRAPLAVGDTLVFYTDGLIECESAAHEPFATGALHRLLRPAAATAQVLHDRIMDAALAHYGGKARADDITLVVVRVTA